MAGLPGPVGLTGFTGDSGRDGLTGQNGIDGAIGLSGIAGETGGTGKHEHYCNFVFTYNRPNTLYLTIKPCRCNWPNWRKGK